MQHVVTRAGMIAIVGLIACTAALSAGGNPEESSVTTIRFLQWWGTEGNVEESLDGLIADFEAEYPEYRVELVTLPFGETKTQIVANHAAGTIADVVGLNPPWTREFYDLGILEPLDDYMAGDPNFNREDYFPASMDPIEGNTYLAPYNTLSFFLYYNRTMFDEAGIGTPQTWTDIVEAADALTDIEANRYGFSLSMSESAAANGSILSLYPLLYAANGRTLVNGRYTVLTEEMRAAFTLLKTMSENGSIAPGATTKTEPMVYEEFSLGNVGMMISNDAHVETLSFANPDLDYGIIPIPTIDGMGQPELRHHGWNLGMPARGADKEAAWTFISFLLRRDNMVRAGLEMKKTPSMYGIDPPPGSSEAVVVVRSYFQTYEMVEELMNMPSAGACWTELTRAAMQVVDGSKTVDEALNECQAAWDRILGQ